VVIRLKDGRSYSGFLTVSDPYPCGGDALGYSIESVRWLVQTTLDPMTVRAIARFLGVHPSQIGSIRTENDRYEPKSPEGPVSFKLSGIAIDVSLKDGRHYLGEISMNFHLDIPVGGYDPLWAALYRVDWLVASNVGVQTLKNIAAALGVNVRDLAQVDLRHLRYLDFMQPYCGDLYGVEITLKDGRRFRGRLLSTGVDDTLGYGIYRVLHIRPRPRPPMHYPRGPIVFGDREELTR
jgi:small nuclear ribonucleoprotein (snRNP)-like protein